MTFYGTQDKCKACDKTVHFIDLLTVDSIPYHKYCFRCSHCKGTLSVCPLLDICSPWRGVPISYTLCDLLNYIFMHELMLNCANFRCAATPPWMGFFTARPILNSCSRQQAPSAKTSPQVSLSCIVASVFSSDFWSMASILLLYIGFLSLQVRRQIMSRYVSSVSDCFVCRVFFMHLVDQSSFFFSCVKTIKQILGS